MVPTCALGGHLPSHSGSRVIFEKPMAGASPLRSANPHDRIPNDKRLKKPHENLTQTTLFDETRRSFCSFGIRSVNKPPVYYTCHHPKCDLSNRSELVTTIFQDDASAEQILPAASSNLIVFGRYQAALLSKLRSNIDSANCCE